MSRRKRRSESASFANEDVLSLSFLDVLSCGMGAAIYLFLVFSVMPHLGSGLGGAAARQRSASSASLAGIGRDAERSRSPEIFITFVLDEATSEDVFPPDPWDGTLPRNAVAWRALKVGKSGLLTGLQVNARQLRGGPIRLRIDPSKTRDGAKGRLSVIIGGSTLPHEFTLSLTKLHTAQGVIAEFDLLNSDTKKRVDLKGIAP